MLFLVRDKCTHTVGEPVSRWISVQPNTCDLVYTDSMLSFIPEELNNHHKELLPEIEIEQ
jgi:hypothetical protein